MSCYVCSLCMQYTWLSLMKLQAKQILSDFTGNWWTIWHQRELCQIFTNKQDEKFLYFINNIDMAARDCVSVFRIILWVVCDMWLLIWNYQVLEQYLGQNILINSNVCGFFPFPSATWNGKPEWWRPRGEFELMICLPIMRHHVLTIHFAQTNTLTFKWQS